MLFKAPDVDTLRSTRSLGFHALMGDRRGQYGIKLTSNVRLVVSLPEGEEGNSVLIEEVVDYHGR